MVNQYILLRDINLWLARKRGYSREYGFKDGKNKKEDCSKERQSSLWHIEIVMFE